MRGCEGEAKTRSPSAEFQMSAKLAMTSDGKKFMWDGKVYATDEAAMGAAESYRNNDFDVRIVKEENNVLVYSRRVVKQGVPAS